MVDLGGILCYNNAPLQAGKVGGDRYKEDNEEIWN